MTSDGVDVVDDHRCSAVREDDIEFAVGGTHRYHVLELLGRSEDVEAHQRLHLAGEGRHPIDEVSCFKWNTLGVYRSSSDSEF